MDQAFRHPRLRDLTDANVLSAFRQRARSVMDSHCELLGFTVVPDQELEAHRFLASSWLRWAVNGLGTPGSWQAYADALLVKDSDVTTELGLLFTACRGRDRVVAGKDLTVIEIACLAGFSRARVQSHVGSRKLRKASGKKAHGARAVMWFDAVLYLLAAGVKVPSHPKMISVYEELKGTMGRVVDYSALLGGPRDSDAVVDEVLASIRGVTGGPRAAVSEPPSSSEEGTS